MAAGDEGEENCEAFFFIYFLGVFFWSSFSSRLRSHSVDASVRTWTSNKPRTATELSATPPTKLPAAFTVAFSKEAKKKKRVRCTKNTQHSDRTTGHLCARPPLAPARAAQFQQPLDASLQLHDWFSRHQCQNEAAPCRNVKIEKNRPNLSFFIPWRYFELCLPALGVPWSGKVGWLSAYNGPHHAPMTPLGRNTWCGTVLASSTRPNSHALLKKWWP